MTQATSANWPHWTVVDLLPHGTAALYLPGDLDREAVAGQLARIVRDGETFLGYRALKGKVFELFADSAALASHEIAELLDTQEPSLLLLHSLEGFKGRKFEDYAELTRIAHSFKVTVLIVPEKRLDALDFAFDTLITVNAPATADDVATYVFKVEARDVPPIRGKASINPASGDLEALK